LKRRRRALWSAFETGINGSLEKILSGFRNILICRHLSPRLSPAHLLAVNLLLAAQLAAGP
jgi:hypothetical protein